MTATSEWNRLVRRVAARNGHDWEDTQFDECTCLQVTRATWDCDAQYAESPSCWMHGEQLPRATWCIGQGAEWCIENNIDPTTGVPLPGSLYSGEWEED